MLATKRCSNCGAEIPPDAPGGLCASCLLAPGLESVANPEPLEPADLTPILVKAAPSLVVKFHSFGDYELLAEVARGGMGVVFRARQLSLNRIVALKFIHPGKLNSSEAVRRFQIEAEATASLDHPNIVPIYEVGEHQGQPYFSMALMAGGTLADRLENRKSKIKDEKGSPRGIRATGAQPDAGGFIPRGEPLLASSLRYPPASAAKLLTTIARAVQHAHERGILHRDLKPGNIVFDAHDQPHLTDFGLAKVLATESHLTLTADVLGSPHYMAPEQAEGKRQPLTTATDIYSLGCILYELLAGRPPFQGETALEILRQVREQEPRLVRGFNPAVDRDLETICLKCLQKDPQRRYGSVEALADDLERWIRQEPIQARPVSTAARLSLWCRRKPALATLFALLFCTGALGLAGVLWQWGEARRQAARAETNAAVTRRQLIQSHVANGHRLAEDGDYLAALPWYVKALELETDPAAIARHRLRIGSTLYLAPRLVQLWAHDGPVNDVTFSRDGRLVASASADRTARIWNAETGELAVPPLMHSNAVLEVAFSLDGRRLLTRAGRPQASGDGLDPGRGDDVLIWEVATGQLAARISHADLVSAASFTPDGRKVLTACYDRKARLCDALTGEVKREFPHPECVLAAVVSPDGQRALTSAGDGRARLWDLKTGELLDDTQGTGEIRHLAFSPDGRLFAALSSNGAWVREVDAPRQMRTFFEGGAPAGAALEFSPDGYKLLLGYSNLKVRICDVATQSRLVALNDEAKVSWVRRYFGARFSPDGSAVLTWGEDGAARVWGALKGWRIYPPLRHSGAVTSADFAPDARRIVTGGSDAFVKVWDLASPASTTPKLFHHIDPTAGAWSPDGRSVASACSDGNVAVWNPNTGERFSTNDLALEASPSEVSLLRWSRDGRRFLTLGGDGAFRVWDGHSFVPFAGPEPGLTNQVLAADFSPDGEVVAVGGDQGAVRLFRSTTGAELKVGPMRHDIAVAGVRFSHNGRWLVTSSSDDVRLWIVATGQPASPPFRLESQVRSLDISPDDALLVVAGNDGNVRILAVPSLHIELPAFQHQSAVLTAVFSPDGKQLLTATEDGDACVWDITSGHKTLTLRHGVAVTSAWFNRDGRRMVTACQLGARVWDAGTGEPLTPWLKLWQFRSGAWNVVPSPTDDRLLSTRGGFAAIVWDLNPDLRPLDLLQAHAKVFSDAADYPTQKEVMQAWRKLRGADPESFKVPPGQALRWHRTMAEFAEVNKKPFTFSFHIERWRQAHPEDNWARHLAVIALISQGRQAEARAIDPFPLPARSSEATPVQLNLEPFYNGRLDAFGSAKDSVFQDLQPGLQSLGGIWFDVRGCIELSGLARLHAIGPLPGQAAGISVRMRARRLHLLHATGGETADGTLIGRYVLHYEDGSRSELPIRYGEDVRNYRYGGGSDRVSEVRHATAVWHGRQRLAQTGGSTIRVFQRTYENPRPDVPIATLDFESTMSSCSPILLAITVEE